MEVTPSSGNRQLLQADKRVKSVLDELGLKYVEEESGSFKLALRFEDGRSQTAWILHGTETIDELEIQEIVSPAYVTEGEISGEVSAKLLADSARRKLGAWETMNTGERSLAIFICDAEDVRILKGVVSKDHVHMHIEYAPSKSISDLVKCMKGRTSRLLQQEYPELRKRYWGKHFGAIGYGAWSTGNLTEELVEEYLEHHRQPSNEERGNFVLE